MLSKYNKFEEKNQIETAAIISYLIIIFNILSGLIYTPWMISKIGQSDYGLYTLSSSLISMFIVDFGIGAAVSRFISKYRAEQNQKKIGEFLGIIYKIYLMISIIIFIILLICFFFIDKIYIQLTINEIEKFKRIYLITGLFTIISFPFMPLDGILVSHEKFIFQKILQLIQKVLTVILMVIALILGFGLYTLVLVNALIGILIIILKVKYITKYNSYNIDFSYKDKQVLKDIFSFSLWTTIILIAQRFILNITPSILGIISGTTEIAIFAVGMTIEGYTYTISTALSGLFLPKVTRIIYGNNNSNKKAIENLMIKVGRIQLIIIGAVITIFTIVGSEFVVLWMGINFKNSYLVALLLIINNIIIVTQEIANTMLIATNKIKYDALSSAITAVISIILSFVFANYWGAIGAAFAIFIGNFIGRVIVKNIVYQNILGINIKRFFVECHIKMSIPLVLMLILGKVLTNLIQANNLLILACKISIMIGIYILIIWLFVLNQTEKNILINIIKRVKMKFSK